MAWLPRYRTGVTKQIETFSCRESLHAGRFVTMDLSTLNAPSCALRFYEALTFFLSPLTSLNLQWSVFCRGANSPVQPRICRFLRIRPFLTARLFQMERSSARCICVMLDHNHEPLKKRLERKRLRVVAELSRKGLDTSGVFNYIDGINNNRPNENDLHDTRAHRVPSRENDGITGLTKRIDR